MSKKVLIDGSQESEVRLLVTDNGEVTDINIQGVNNDHTRGNIYLAKVLRVEASLQAVFIDYGDEEKNGFLPFVEIHPSNFQIPSNEKQELMEQLAKLDQVSSENIDLEDERKNRQRYFDILSKYKVQEVIKRDQIILVQVTKERRGSKGAAFTTYISIPGRFCVFMPNSLNQGGVSRKISDSAERDRLKSLLTEFHEKHGKQSCVVIRTAGEFKTKVEIRRDLEYAEKIWKNIKKHTLNAIAPCFIYKEADVIKQAIRDLYKSEIEEIVVSGKKAFDNTVAFMEMILPRHVDKVKYYNEATPIFIKYDVEEQINNLYNNEVELKSGGHIVIQQTEALISIDVNSGKYTDERNVENTALRTNIEAAKESVKQIMLRSLSGLVVIDFIDMKNDENKLKVEKELRKAFAEDRAKIVMGKIGKFGLLELSRQRIKQPFLEANTVKCERCNGKGLVRRSELTNSSIIRNLDYFLRTQKSSGVNVIASLQTVFSLMQHCKRELLDLEEKYNANISFQHDNSISAEVFYIEQVSKDQQFKTDYALSEADEARYGNNTYRNKTGNTKNKDFNSNADSLSNEIKGNLGAVSSNERNRGNRSNRRSQKRDSGNIRRKLDYGKRVDKTEKLQKTESESIKKTVSSEQNTSLLKDIWRKIID